MPERGKGGADRPGDGPDDGSDYGWLYGSDRPAPPQGQTGRRTPEDPEPTRMMPQMERPGSSPSKPPSQTPPRRPAPTAPTAPTARPSRPRGRDTRARKIILVLLVAWLAFLVTVPLWAWTRIEKVDADPEGNRPDDQPGTTYLLVGSDSRKGLSKKENQRLGTGGVGDVGQRTDTIMLLHTGDGPNLLLSIPRDSLVPIPGHGTTKINAAFALGGPKLLVQTVEQNTGVRIDHYVEIGFGGFVNSVDAVGGITVCPKSRMVDPKANLDIRKGCQEVDGVVALGYARSRQTSQLGDIDRARHQREVVSAIGAEVKSPWTFINPVRYFRVNNAATSSVVISEGTGPFSLARFALAMTAVNGKDGLTCSMPIADLAVNWDRERALALLKLIKEDRTADIPKRLCSATGQA